MLLDHRMLNLFRRIIMDIDFFTVDKGPEKSVSYINPSRKISKSYHKRYKNILNAYIKYKKREPSSVHTGISVMNAIFHKAFSYKKIKRSFPYLFGVDTASKPDRTHEYQLEFVDTTPIKEDNKIPVNFHITDIRKHKSNFDELEEDNNNESPKV